MSLYIPHVEYGIDAQYIANTFYYQNIATIKRITLIPYIKPVGKYDYICLQRAYIDIHMWHDSEAAYSFIQRVRSPSIEARIIYDIIDEAAWWVVEENFLPWITTSKKTRSKTIEFEIMEDDDERLEDILIDLEYLEEIEELEKYVHPVDDDLEWKELEQMIRAETNEQVI
jgi:hypothetical protein